MHIAGYDLVTRAAFETLTRSFTTADGVLDMSVSDVPCEEFLKPVALFVYVRINTFIYVMTKYCA